MTDPALTELERSLAAVLRVFGDRTTTADLADRSGHTLPHVSWTLLEYLNAYAYLRVSDIAACHGVDVSSVVPQLKKLEIMGLLTRERAPTDKRAHHVSITAKGTEVLASVHAARREMLDDAVGDLDPADIAAAASVLRQLADNMTREPPPGDPGAPHLKPR